MNYDSLKLAPEFDALVAEKVMAEPHPNYIVDNALNIQLSGDIVKSEKGCWMLICDYEKGDNPEWHPLPFSTDIASAWQVYEKLRSGFEWCCLDLHSDFHYNWTMRLTRYEEGTREGHEHKPTIVVSAETAPLAICLAALKAVEATASV